MNPTRNMVVPSGFGNSGQPFSVSNQAIFTSQPHNQTHGGSQFSGHHQLSDPQAQALAQSQFVHSHSQPQAQAAHSQFRTQLQPQGHPNHVRSLSQGISTSGSGGGGGLSSSQNPTPSSASAKRAPQKPPSKSHASSSGNATSQFKSMELALAPRRKKRKASEKEIPDKLVALLPESALYTKLVELESQVDAALARKKMDIHESVKNPPHFKKTLRIYVFNTFCNQMQTDVEAKSSESPSWTLKVFGRILEDEVDSNSTVLVHKSNSYPKFSSFFKRITIYLDQSLYPDNHVILWENSRSPTLHEGFEVKRKGDKEFTAILRLEMNYVPEKLRLSSVLAQALGIEVETRARVVSALWQYVKVMKLQDPNDSSVFICDPPLRKVFGDEKIKFTTASQKLSQHLSPLQPIHLEHRIKLSGDSPSGNTCYDVLVDVPFPLEKEMSAYLANMEKHREIDAYDEVIASAIKKIHEHRRRRGFFLGFSQSPAEFINTLIASQNRDLKVMASDFIHNAEKARHAEFFDQQWVEDAVTRYLNRKPSAGVDTARNT